MRSPFLTPFMRHLSRRALMASGGAAVLSALAFLGENFAAAEPQTGGTIAIVPDPTPVNYAPQTVRFTVDLSLASFDTTETYDPVPDISYNSGYRPAAHGLIYLWDTGDAGNWQAPTRVPDKSKRYASGFFIQHTFGEVGDHITRVLVLEPSTGKFARAETTVTVNTPASAFTDPIIAVNPHGDTDFSWAPAGSEHVNVDASGEMGRNNEPILSRKGTARHWMFKPGETFVMGMNFAQGDVAPGHFFDCPDASNPATLQRKNNANGDILAFSGWGVLATFKFARLNLRGQFDPATTLAGNSPAGNNAVTCDGRQSVDVTFYQCDIRNFRDPVNITQNNLIGAPSRWAFADCVFEDNAGYSILVGNSENTEFSASIQGCRFRQSTLAAATDTENDSFARINMIEWQYVAKCDFFGFVESNAPLKVAEGNAASGEFPVIGAVNVNVHDCVIEGALACIWIARGMNDRGATVHNILVDNCILIGTWALPEFVVASACGITMRGNRAWRPDILAAGSPPLRAFIRMDLNTTVSGAQGQTIPAGPIRIEHNTMINDLSAANGQSGAAPMVGDVNGQFIAAGVIEEAYNLVHHPNLASPETPFGPISMDPLVPSLNTDGRRTAPSGAPDVSLITTGSMPTGRPLETSPAIAAIAAATGPRDPLFDADHLKRPDARSIGALEPAN